MMRYTIASVFLCYIRNDFIRKKMVKLSTV